MVRFVDGPASSVMLCLQRSPLYLRAVRNSAGEWDALDRLEDRVEPGEEVFVYLRVWEGELVHLCRRVEGKDASGWFRRASYRWVEPQPSSEVVRDNELWRAWCLEQQKATAPKQEEQPRP